ncbi:MAG: 6-phosphofructokinase [Deltaproteobacteria bacterium]|nr:6-phosphofructokinase [Deltaproteobacteria bacterium]MBW2415562.1 6-phosphofructokinase [Deltaproteobacteria bacterium]
MRIGLLTGGGDCPGLNAVIRAVVLDTLRRDGECVGVLEGWRGLIDDATRRLGRDDVRSILHQGGTILRTSRTNPFRSADAVERLLATWKKLELDALVAIGGEDTLGVAARLFREFDLPIVGVPKTIDNDLSGTDYTFGFDTAVSIATDAIDRLATTAESHNRVIVVEVMGREAGWIATHAGIAGGAAFIAIPEREVSVAEIGRAVRARAEAGQSYSIIVVAEGAAVAGLGRGRRSAADEFGHALLGGIGQQVADALEAETGFETRVTVLGHIQRGGSPTAYDRVLATRLGLHASELAHKGDFGRMAALSGAEITSVTLEEAVAEVKTVPSELSELAAIVSG